MIVLSFFSMITAAFFVYSAATTNNYRQLRINEVFNTAAFESELVNKMISEMEYNAINLAFAGYHYYISGEHTDELGISIVVENFTTFSSAVGGGIWFEPYALANDKRRVCYYAFFDPAARIVRHDPEFLSEEYDYHTQMWYTTIASRIYGRYSTAWTAPYFDEIGTVSLMTTVGAGIYNEEGTLIGMSTVDWQIQNMVDRLSTIKPTENSFILLASLRDDYIISNTYYNGTEYTGLSLQNLPWYNELIYYYDNSVGIGHFTQGGVEYISFSRLFSNGWLFSIVIPSHEIFAEIEIWNNHFTIIIAVSFLTLLVLASYLLSRLINRPLYKLTSGVAELGSGNLNKRIEVHSKDEIGTLAIAFNKMTIDLKASIEQSARERAEKERISAELDVATKIQVSMLPGRFPAFPDRMEFSIYATMQPAKEVGGDFYDFFMVDNNTLAVVIADVSGKGVPAALFMVITKTLIKNNAQYGKSPKDVFDTVNKLLCENNEADMFVTAFMGYLDISSGKFSFVNAGHNPPLLKRAGSVFEWFPVKPGFILAGFEDTSYKQDEITLGKGDLLYLYTDGVTEAFNCNEEMFTDFRFLETANKYKDACLTDLLNGIKSEIDLFADGAEQADDITMLVLKIAGSAGMKEMFIDAAVENLDTVIDFVSAELEKAGCPLDLQSKIALAVEEVFVNIVYYAYKSVTPSEIGGVIIRMAVDSEVTIEFEDKGKAYNPLEKEDPDINAAAVDREIGGLGIFMVKKIMDSVEYRYEDGKNILILRKVIV